MSTPRGYRITKDGARAWVRLKSTRDGFNELKTRRWTGDVTPAEIREWRATAKDELHAMLQARRRARAAIAGAPSSGFRHDVLIRYLPAVQAMTTYEERVRDIMLWVEEFQDRDRHGIQPHEIRAVRDRWLTVGPKRKYQKVNGVGQWVDVAEPLAASTVNHRLRALSNVWTVLDPRLPNPVRDVPEAVEPKAIPRAVDYELLRSIIHAVANQGRPMKDQPRPTESISKAAIRAMVWAGLEPSDLSRLSDEDILDGIDAGVLAVPGRRKGEGAEPRLVPLNADAMAALSDFVRLRQSGIGFNRRAALHAWQRACRRVIGRPLRLKDIRHSFVTRIVKATNNLDLAQRLAGHADARTTGRYALAAMLPMLRAGMDATFPKETDSDEHDQKHVLPETPRSHGRTPARVRRHRPRLLRPHKETGGDRS